MRVKRLGHVVLRVRELERSVRFYGEVLGLREVARYGGRMVFFSLGENHHDLALQEVGAGAPSPHPRSVGLYHVAFKVGDGIEELRAWRDHLERHSVPILGASDHRVSQALYVTDPDGIEIELYVDADPAVWRNDPSAVATIEPIDL